MANSIVLDVSGRKFKTEKMTLQESPYFASLLARWDDCSDRQEDGSYFVDADPDTFQHILNFMRRPSRFPLFWTKDKGFDYALYNQLEVEADYFALEDLHEWIRDQKYLKAVIIVTRIERRAMLDGVKMAKNGNVEIRSSHGADVYGHHVFQEVVFNAEACVNAGREAARAEVEQASSVGQSSSASLPLRPLSNP